MPVPDPKWAHPLLPSGLLPSSLSLLSAIPGAPSAIQPPLSPPPDPSVRSRREEVCGSLGEGRVKALVYPFLRKCLLPHFSHVSHRRPGCLWAPGRQMVSGAGSGVQILGAGRLPSSWAPQAAPWPCPSSAFAPGSRGAEGEGGELGWGPGHSCAASVWACPAPTPGC